MVQTVKSTIRKCQATKGDLKLAMLRLRATPIASNMPSPAELMLNRSIRTDLPSRGYLQANQQYEYTHKMIKDKQENTPESYMTGRQ